MVIMHTFWDVFSPLFSRAPWTLKLICDVYCVYYRPIHQHLTPVEERSWIGETRTMEDPDDFLYNASLSCFCLTKMYGFDPSEHVRYQTALNQLLKTNLRDVDKFVSIQWSNDELGRSLVYIRCEQSLHRFCLFYWPGSNGALLITNCAPHVNGHIFGWMRMNFDCIIEPLQLPCSVLRAEYEAYLVRCMTRNLSVGDSQLILLPQESAPELRKITLAVRGDDIIGVCRRAEKGHIVDAIFQHLDKHTAMSFEQMVVDRVNCGGFVMTRSGKLKLFKRGYNSEDMQRLLEKIGDRCKEVVL
jgi:hypothetical protein